MRHGLIVVAGGSRQALVCIAMALGSITAAAAPVAAAERAGGKAVCAAQSTAAGLDVRCPSATVSELMSALQQATGLRSEYPQELAPARVSVTLRRPALLEVLESALSAFNFAVWTDQASPSVTWVKILDTRRAVGRAEPPQAYRQRSKPSLEEAATADLSPSNNEAQMAEVRESFANSVTSTPEVEPIPVVTSPVIMPGVGVPR